ncbi:hypothetical protein DS901_08535 [Loktanella sp. D2R18]|uniref:DUF4259 domain-containing protein n=1 Tax=Rhodobacterales TaxID=204455 RepID=UPI000DE97048|nr:MULTISPECIES: DUF4259 domain-containing protein [Rhodobacterales]MDO6589814.1 DUF4259 domain-containing protein [Yoonia sp. 1_MG-2023]RBW44431.1 hypothetical protein DS901_08535 [Loktanella sp. D2R18]
MGAWGVGSLDNDGSQDWLTDFGEFGASAATDILDACSDAVASGYVESDIGTGVIALAEVVAAALGKPDEDLADQLEDPVENHKDALLEIDNVQARTSEALEALMADAETSELYDLWAETDELDDWLTQMKTLRARLDAA